jgi:hypothetical protein
MLMRRGLALGVVAATATMLSCSTSEDGGPASTAAVVPERATAACSDLRAWILATLPPFEALRSIAAEARSSNVSQLVAEAQVLDEQIDNYVHEYSGTIGPDLEGAATYSIMVTSARNLFDACVSLGYAEAF